ncbi:hypothetical protein [Nitrobacter winogradskyi]|nr:hypothetical protein [Nitrobacter winogradskyi]
MNQLAIDYAGSVLNGGFIVLPSHLSIALKDAVRDLAQRCPEVFADIEATPNNASITQTIISEVRTRRKRSLPSDWSAVRERMTGITAEMMDQIAQTRQGK